MAERAVYYLCLGLITALAILHMAEGFSFADENVVSRLVTVNGTIKSVDAAKGDMVLIPEGSESELVVKVPDKALLKGRKSGDKVKLTYRPGRQNITERLSKKREIIIPVGCGGGS